MCNVLRVEQLWAKLSSRSAVNVTSCTAMHTPVSHNSMSSSLALDQHSWPSCCVHVLSGAVITQWREVINATGLWWVLGKGVANVATGAHQTGHDA